MRTKNARLDEVDKKENDFATKKASFTQDEVSKQEWHKRNSDRKEPRGK